MASINEFKGVVNSKKGLARSNLYSVILPSLAGINTSDLNILCSNVNLPGRQLQTYDKNIGTKFEKVAYGSVTDDVAMTFYAMNDYGVRKYFDAWQRLAFDADSYQIGYKSNYTRQITINQLTKSVSAKFDILNFATIAGNPLNFFSQPIVNVRPEQIIYSCSLFEAFPISTDAVPLTGELDGLVQITAAFSYSKWVSNELQGLASIARTVTDFELPLVNIVTRIFD